MVSLCHPQMCHFQIDDQELNKVVLVNAHVQGGGGGVGGKKRRGGSGERLSTLPLFGRCTSCGALFLDLLVRGESLPKKKKN